MKKTNITNRSLCHECINRKQWLRQNEDYRYVWVEECLVFNDLLTKTKSKCQNKYFKKKAVPQSPMKVIAMISWERAQKYPYCVDQNNFKEFWECVKSFLLEKNIKYNGGWHQNWKYGIPIVEYDGRPYAFALRQRGWGRLMVETFDPNNNDPLAYVDWAFTATEGEEFTIEENKNPLFYPKKGEYNDTKTGHNDK